MKRTNERFRAGKEFFNSTERNPAGGRSTGESFIWQGYMVCLYKELLKFSNSKIKDPAKIWANNFFF